MIFKMNWSRKNSVEICDIPESAYESTEEALNLNCTNREQNLKTFACINYSQIIQ